jgi:lipopolysaccharide transport system ATP-binding protein
MFQGHGKKSSEQLLPQIHEFYDRPVRTYSAGMRLRLGFSVALVNEVDLLLIDEVKAEKAMETKVRGDHAVVFISRNIDLVAKICTRAFWIKCGVVQSSGAANEVTASYRKCME